MALQSDIFDGDGYHGAESDTDLFLDIRFDGDGYHGGESDADFDDNPAADLDGDSYHGSDSIAEISVSVLLGGDSYHGHNSDTDFDDNPAADLDGDSYHGGNGAGEVSVSVSFFPLGYHGANSDADFTDSPSEGIGIADAYHGAESDIPTLGVVDVVLAYLGEHSDSDIQTSANFRDGEMYHGHNVDAILARSLILPTDSYHGANVDILFTDAPSEGVGNVDAYHGSNVDIDFQALQSFEFTQILPIVASQAMYDGLGTAGGINHCPLPPEFHHPRILGFDPGGVTDKLNFEFGDELWDKVYNTCNLGGIGFQAGLATFPRFEGDSYAGSNVETYIPRKVVALAGEIPPSELYNDTFIAIINNPVFEFEMFAGSNNITWDDPEDAVVYHGIFSYTNELEVRPFTQSYMGSSSETEFSTVVPNWRGAIPPIMNGASVRVAFEPVLTSRFCPGYFVPSGSNLIFEHGIITDVNTCEGYTSSHGIYSNSEMQITPDFNDLADMEHGAFLSNSELTTAELIQSNSYHGAAMFVAQVADFDGDSYHGHNTSSQFFNPPINAYHGISSTIDTLEIGVPGIVWVTPSISLPNKFIPSDEFGDPIEGVFVSPKPTEELDFVSDVIAQCVINDGN